MLDTSKIYTSNSCGDLRVIEYVNANNVIIEFINTGHKTKTRADHVKDGLVKDVLSPTVLGVGFVGIGNHKAYVNGKLTNKYRVWNKMLTRCYSNRHLKRCPTYKGCSVVEEWHSFQKFGDWFDVNYIKGYQLDKDIKVNGNKVYGPSTCLFVTKAENVTKAFAKDFKFTSPQGEMIEIYNLSEFCRGNGLSSGRMSEVHNGKRSHHQGWTKYL